MDMCSSPVNYHPKLIRVENMTCVALICAVCVMKLVKIKKLNVMTEDNGEDGDESLNR